VTVVVERKPSVVLALTAFGAGAASWNGALFASCV